MKQYIRIFIMKRYVILALLCLTPLLHAMDRPPVPQDAESVKNVIFTKPHEVDYITLCSYLEAFPDDFMKWRDDQGNTFLHRLARFSEDKSIIQLLLHWGSDELSLKNAKSQTAKDVAIEANNEVMCEVLEDYERTPLKCPRIINWSIVEHIIHKDGPKRSKIALNTRYTKGPWQSTVDNPHVDGSQDNTKKSGWLGTLYDYATIRNALITGVGIYLARLAWKRYMSPTKEEVQ